MVQVSRIDIPQITPSGVHPRCLLTLLVGSHCGCLSLSTCPPAITCRNQIAELRANRSAEGVAKPEFLRHGYALDPTDLNQSPDLGYGNWMPAAGAGGCGADPGQFRLASYRNSTARWRNCRGRPLDDRTGQSGRRIGSLLLIGNYRWGCSPRLNRGRGSIIPPVFWVTSGSRRAELLLALNLVLYRGINFDLPIGGLMAPSLKGPADCHGTKSTLCAAAPDRTNHFVIGTAVRSRDDCSGCGRICLERLDKPYVETQPRHWPRTVLSNTRSVLAVTRLSPIIGICCPAMMSGSDTGIGCPGAANIGPFCWLRLKSQDPIPRRLHS